MSAGSPNGDGAETPRQQRTRISRDIASLAAEWEEQGQKLKVRQREQLRRAMTAAAEVLSWEPAGEKGLDSATKDIAKLAKSGVRSIRKDLDSEREDKRKEAKGLAAAVKALRKMADDGKSEWPAEYSYTHTARSPSRGLVTELEELELASPDEAHAAADTIEKHQESWEKLRKEMLEELKSKDQQWADLIGSLSAFAGAYRGLLEEVLFMVV